MCIMHRPSSLTRSARARAAVRTCESSRAIRSAGAVVTSKDRGLRWPFAAFGRMSSGSRSRLHRRRRSVKSVTRGLAAGKSKARPLRRRNPFLLRCAVRRARIYRVWPVHVNRRTSGFIPLLLAARGRRRPGDTVRFSTCPDHLLRRCAGQGHRFRSSACRRTAREAEAVCQTSRRRLAPVPEARLPVADRFTLSHRALHATLQRNVRFRMQSSSSDRLEGEGP